MKTNIYDPKIITDNGEDTSVSTTAASSAVKVNNTVKKADDKPEKLPQTGQDWISAIVLALSGFFMLAVGAMIKEK